jgi:drug/metabolite transporter (DMT)-like permease
MAFSATVFAVMNFLARVASSSASWTTVAAVRSIVGALVAVAVSRMRGTTLAPKEPRALFWRSFIGTIAMIGTFYSLSSRSVSLGDTVTLLNLAPVFMALLAPMFLRERTTGAVAIAILVALGGVILIVRPSFLFPGSHLAAEHVSVAGPGVGITVAAALMGALSTSIALMMLRRAGQTETPEAISFHFAVFAAITMCALSLFDLRTPTLRDALCMVGAGVCGGVAQLTMAAAYARAEAARVGGMSYLNPVVSMLLGAIALHEAPASGAVLGMVLIIGAGLAVTFARPTTAPPADVPARGSLEP